MADAPSTDAPETASADALDDLRRRLVLTRRIPLLGGLGWSRGTDPDYLAELLGHWATDYDWSHHEARLLALPWQLVPGLQPVRVIHQRVSPDAPTVVLLHGWPDSFLRFERVLPLLGDVNVVVPCLPGYPYGGRVTRPGMSSTAMAMAIAAAVAELGYDRYVVSGGDVGSSVGEAMAAAYPERVTALHLTDVPYHHLFTVDPEQLTDEEQDYLARGRGWQLSEGAYALEQATKPHTLAVGLGDSPAGLAAWIVEKLRSWSDCGGDVESVFARDELLTWITLYWVTGAIGSSFLPYVEEPHPPTGRIDVPTVVSIFPHDLVPAPRSFGERFFDVRSWTEHPDGGHFAAWERPEAYVAELRTAIELSVR